MTQTKQKSRSSSFLAEKDGYDKVTLLSNMGAEHAGDVLDALGVDYMHSGKRLSGSCPVHGGDNRGAFSMYPDGYIVKGFWKCRTHHCEKVFKSSFIGCVRGILSNQKRGWQRPGDRAFSFDDTIQWLCDFLGVKFEDIDIDHEEIDKNRFIAQVATVQKAVNEKENSVSRNLARSKLIIPSQYYLCRGYTADILDRYDVGYCDEKSREMYGRVVVPVYDDDYNGVIGCTARTIEPQCPKCNLYHSPEADCPDRDNLPGYEVVKYFKWRNNKGFKANNHLYNYWFAKDFIRSSQVVILVEGPGDVWRMVEAGIRNVVAIFGTDLSDEQQFILECSGATSVIVMLDNDDNNAGQLAAKEIKKKLERSFRLYFPQFDFHDVGDLHADKVTSDIKPFIDKVVWTRS